ncbi:MAG TPA: hypothetical protein VJR26_07585 [Candidatus Acidoferrales bacterium]|nr:hypothetical protein [Candidatus Acidoferrales bacterium]
MHVDFKDLLAKYQIDPGAAPSLSILEVLPADTDDETIENREQNWMLRLRTRTRAHGLNLPELDY